MRYYSICGLSVASAVPLSGAIESLPGREPADVLIRRQTVPPALEQATVVTPNWQLADGHFLLHVPGILRMSVRDGREILADPAPGQDMNDVAPFILSTGIAALLLQRRRLVLHAATVARQGQAIALCGPTGAGKSTLAAALCRNGYDFVGDDAAAIDFDGDGYPTVTPDGRRHRLWADAIEHLGLEGRRGMAVRGHLRKFHVQPEQENSAATLPLAGVVILRNCPQASAHHNTTMQRLDLVDAAPSLRAEVYRGTLARKMGLDGNLFGQIAQVLRHVPVWRLERNFDFPHMDDSLRIILGELQQVVG